MTTNLVEGEVCPQHPQHAVGHLGEEDGKLDGEAGEPGGPEHRRQELGHGDGHTPSPPPPWLQ